MTNEEKAWEITDQISKNYFFNSTKECFESAIKMAQWKDEQLTKIVSDFLYEKLTSGDLEVKNIEHLINEL